MSFDAYMPLDVDEVMFCLKKRWDVTYDLQVVVRQKRLYLQIMWAYLEQQSFPLNEEEYKYHLNQVLEIVNRLGQAGVVREWLNTINQRPRLGKAITFPLSGGFSLEEFVV